MLLLALFLALLLDSPFAHARPFYRLIYFIPYAVPGVVAAIVWANLYSPSIGPLQNIVNHVGGGTNLLGPNTLLYSIMVIVTWSWTGYNMTILAAGLTSIPPELVEAARIDGASELRIAVQIKVPMLRALLLLTSVLSIIGTLQMFSEPYIFRSLTVIPTTYTPNIDIYNQAFTFGSFNYATTLAVVLSGLTFLMSGIFLLITSRRQRRGVA
jgi:multiple sugar transport system permease protein